MLWISSNNKRREIFNNLSLDTSHALATCHHKFSCTFFFCADIVWSRQQNVFRLKRISVNSTGISFNLIGISVNLTAMSVNLTWSSDNSTGVFVNLTEDFKGVGNRKNNGMSWIPLHNKRRALINNLSLDTSHALETCHYKHSMHFSLLRRHCMESSTEFARISIFFVIGALIDSGNDSRSS